MALTPADVFQRVEAPVNSASTLRTLDLTTANATIALVEGVYEIVNSGSVYAVASLTGTTAAMPPATGAAEVTAFMLPPSTSVQVRVALAGETLNARTLSSTATLYLMRKASL